MITNPAAAAASVMMKRLRRLGWDGRVRGGAAWDGAASCRAVPCDPRGGRESVTRRESVTALTSVAALTAAGSAAAGVGRRSAATAAGAPTAAAGVGGRAAAATAGPGARAAAGARRDGGT